MNSGFLQNVGTGGGALASVWGLNVGGLYYPSANLALGCGYRSSFDFGKGTVPLSGWFGVGRGYVWGQGTRSTIDASRMVMERHDRIAIYTGLELGQTSYYLGSNAAVVTNNPNGSYLNVNALLGMEITLSDHIELNLEGGVTALTLSSSDERYRVRGVTLSAGISYLF